MARTFSKRDKLRKLRRLTSQGRKLKSYSFGLSLGNCSITPFRKGDRIRITKS